MKQEEKAKRYDELANKLKRVMAQGVDPLITRADVQDFFPELIEPNVKEDLLEFLNELYIKGNKFTNFDKWKKADCAAWISWVEKQGNK